jgi:transcriptional regulator with XRE-family HTH domain
MLLYKYPNDLSQARKRMHLSRKRVAMLIGKTIYTVNRYETGALVPTLKTLLQLEIIFRMPVAFLYQQFYAVLRQDLRDREVPESTASPMAGARGRS